MCYLFVLFYSIQAACDSQCRFVYMKKKLINTKWCYRCPNENCAKTSNAYKVENFNDDGRYVYTKEGGRFTAIKQHMMKCLTVERCIVLLEGDKNQNKLEWEDFDNSSFNSIDRSKRFFQGSSSGSMYDLTIVT